MCSVHWSVIVSVACLSMRQNKRSSIHLSMACGKPGLLWRNQHAALMLPQHFIIESYTPHPSRGSVRDSVLQREVMGHGPGAALCFSGKAAVCCLGDSPVKRWHFLLVLKSFGWVLGWSHRICLLSQIKHKKSSTLSTFNLTKPLRNVQLFTKCICVYI